MTAKSSSQRGTGFHSSMTAAFMLLHLLRSRASVAVCLNYVQRKKYQRTADEKWWSELPCSGGRQHRSMGAQEHGWWSSELNLECKFYFYMNSNLNPKMLMLPSTAWKMISPLWNLTQELWPLSSDWHSSSLWEQWRDWAVECWGRLLIVCQMGPAPQWPMPCTYSKSLAMT